MFYNDPIFNHYIYETSGCRGANKDWGMCKENEMSRFVGAADATVLHRQQAAVVKRWMDTQPFHEHCPFPSISALLSVGPLQPLWQGRPESAQKQK